MIKTKSVYDPVDLESDGFRILIMRKWPRGIGYMKHSIHKWSKELGPSRQLLDKWNKNEIAWGDYVTKYSAEQTCSVVAKIETDSISKMSIHKNCHTAVQGERKWSTLSQTRPEKYCKWSC